LPPHSFILLSALNGPQVITYLFSDVPGIAAKKIAEQAACFFSAPPASP
jgi:hypothetical protein